MTKKEKKKLTEQEYERFNELYATGRVHFGYMHMDRIEARKYALRTMSALNQIIEIFYNEYPKKQYKMNVLHNPWVLPQSGLSLRYQIVDGKGKQIKMWYKYKGQIIELKERDSND